MPDWRTLNVRGFGGKKPALVYDFFKDFAGPFATVVASVTVALATFYFQSRHAHLAEQRLRLDLFEKRYAKLLDAKKLIEVITYHQDLEGIEPGLIRDLFVSLAEGQFLLSGETNFFLKKICETAEGYLKTSGDRQSLNKEDVEMWRRSGDALAKQIASLRALYAQIPGQFDRDLHIEER